MTAFLRLAFLMLKQGLPIETFIQQIFLNICYVASACVSDLLGFSDQDGQSTRSQEAYILRGDIH